MSNEAQEIWKILNDIAKSHAESNTILAELRNSQLKTDAQLAKTDAQLAKTEAQLAKTSIKLDAVAKQLGDIGHSNGDAAESFFFNSLEIRIDKLPYINGSLVCVALSINLDKCP